MNKRKLDNETVDGMARKIFANGRISDGDIDRIVANPRLFDSVCRRVAADAGARPSRLAALLPVSLKVAAFPALVIVAIAAAGLLRPEEGIQTVSDNRVPDAFPEKARPVIPPQEEVKESLPGRAIKADYRTVKPRPRRVINKLADKPQAIPDDEFYAVSYTGEDHKMTGGRIMRVELKRSSLFALGINLPLENDAETVKADLLISSDGVTRGLRIVK